MSTFKCKMCGGTLEIQNGSTVAECEYCGAKQTLPKLDDEKRVNLYDRANHFRRSNEFDKASAIYEQILNEDNTDAEAYWSLVLCRYGIEYVEDPLSHRRIPTVNRAQFTSIFDDDNYKSALKNADSYQRIIYEEEAKAINEIQKGILAISQKEEPFDVFICYKETDANGKRTHDSVLAQDLYYQLKQEGFKVFFARITLEDKLGSAYEPYIFAALNSAKVMVVLGTKPEHFNAVWVKNEWSRFLSLIKHGEKKMLIPAYKDMDPYDLPTEFSHLQAQDMSKLGFMQDLIRGIKKILGKDNKPTPTVTERVIVNNEGPDTAPLLRRAFLFLEDGDFDDADEYAEKVLDINPECAEAYVVKLLIELKLKKPSDLAQYKAPIADSHNYQKAIRFATPEYRATIEGYNNAIIKRLDTERKEKLYANGIAMMRAHKYGDAINSFQQITAYKDAAQKVEECKKLKETQRLETIYAGAMQNLNASKFDEATKLFSSIADYKDAQEKVKYCAEAKESARKNKIYTQALQRVAPNTVNDVTIKQSIEDLHTISGYRDVDDQIRILNQRLDKWYEDKRMAEEKAKERAEAARRERERKAEIRRIKLDKAKKIAKKVAIISMISIVSVTVLLVLLFTLVIPLMRYNKADKLFNAGEYDAAMQIYDDLNGFSESEQRIAVLNGIEQIEESDFEKGIHTILEAGVSVKLTYGMDGGDFSGTEHISNSESSGMTNLSSPLTANVVPLTTTDSIPETTEFLYSSITDFSGIQMPERNGYRFVQWNLDAYAYQIDGTFELKLTAVWSTKSYTIDYDFAGGEPSGTVIAGYNTEDESFTLANPTRTGYTFTGWTGTGLDDPSVEVIIPTGSYGDRTYTATWKANEYTVTYDAAGGTVSSETQTVIYDSDVEYLIPERTGYAFLGWYEDETKHENEHWTRTDDLSLVAKWEIIEYDIRYDMDGGDNSPENPIKYTVNDQITLIPPQKTGYTFSGWTYMGQSTPVTNITIPAGTIGEQRYTANWEANIYTITFDANGGSASLTTMAVSYDQNYTLPEPEWVGHSFSGWYAGTQKVTDGTWTRTSDTQLIAKWDIIEYSITYDLNGGTNASANPSGYTINDSFSLVDPIKAGYTFLGWTFENQNTPTKDVTVIVGTTGDKNYIANWQVNTYTVTLDANGGTVSPETLDATYDTVITLPDPTREGYRFDGWFADTQQYSTGIWLTDSDITLVAKWSAISYTVTYDDVTTQKNHITITFDNNYPGSLIKTYVLNNGDGLSYPTNPTRSGYVFIGWYTDSNCNNLYDFSGTITEDMTLYAGWSTCTVTNDYYYAWSSSNGVLTSTNQYNNTSSTYKITATMPMTISFSYKTSSELGYDYLYIKKNGSTLKTCSGSTSYSSYSVSLNTGDYLEFTYSKDSMYSSGYDCAYITDLSYTSDVYYTSTATASCSDSTGLVYNTESNHAVTIVFGENYDLLIPSRTGYTFDGWYNGNTKVESGDWSIANDVTLTAEWVKNQYTVSLDPNGGTGVDAEQIVTYDTEYTLPTPTRTGYTFDGWFCADVEYSGGIWLTPENITLVAKWSSKTDISYVVNHYQQNANDDGYTLESTQNLTGTADAEITPVVKTFEHFVSPAAQIVTIAPDGSLVVNYYYDRVTYNLTYVTNGGDTIEQQTYKYDQTLVIETPTRAGYTFGGWFTDKTLGTAYSATATLNENTTIYAYWSEENKPSDFTYSGTDAITVSAYNGTSTTMWIPAYIGGVPVTTIPASAFKDQTTLVKVVVPNTLTSWGYGVLAGCSSIVELTIPYVGHNTDSQVNHNALDSWFATSSSSTYYNTHVPTSLKTVNITVQTKIPACAFYDCKYIEEINIPENVDSIRYSAFKGCSSLIRLNSTVDGVLNVPNKVTLIESTMFENCVLAEYINIGESVPEIQGGAFRGCVSLVMFTIPESVESIGREVFSGCTSLLKINSTVDGELNIPASVKTIGYYAFKGLAGITKVTVPDSVTSLGTAMFEGCTSLEELTLPFMNNDATDTDYFSKLFKDANSNEYVPSSVKKVTITAQTVIPNYAFYNCKYIEEINIPETTTSIGAYAFSGCSALARLNSTVDGVFNIPEGVTEIKGYLFYNCLLAETINLNENTTVIGTRAFDGCKSLASFVIPATVETIESYAFNGCISILKINSTVDGELNIPASVKTIGSYAFKGLAGITKVTVPDSVTSLGTAMFDGCTCIEELTLPFMNNDATDTDYFSKLFKDSNSNEYVPSSIKKVTITAQTTIPAYAFNGCKYIEEINIPAATTSIGSNAFSGCTALLRLNSEIDGVFNIPDGLTDIQSYAFRNCLLAEVITVGDSIININDYAFANCTSIKQFNSTNNGELVIPESVRVIGSYTFNGLTEITKVLIPDSVTEINANAFKGCTSIEEITLPFVGRKVGETDTYYMVFGTIFGYNSGSISNHPYRNYDIPQSIKKVTITAQTVIPEYAFRNCTFIENIILPSTVTSVSDNSFYNCIATVAYTYIATTSIWNGTDISTSFVGSGTVDAPYQINSAADLAYLASSVNAGENYSGKYFILNTNINLNTKSWTPIGTKNKAFEGTFDGNGKKIYNLSVTMDTAYAGLFGYVSGTIKNLGVFSGTLSPASKAATTYVGPLVAYLAGTVENCYSQAVVTVNITNIIYAGGLIGDTTASVKNSYASGHVSAVSSSGFAYAGGFVGANKGTIEGCLAFGDVTAKASNDTYSRNGGFVATNDGTLKECYRNEAQNLVKYTTAGSAYCEDGSVDSLANMIAFAQSNWNSAVWEYTLKFPTFK